MLSEINSSPYLMKEKLDEMKEEFAEILHRRRVEEEAEAVKVVRRYLMIHPPAAVKGKSSSEVIESTSEYKALLREIEAIRARYQKMLDALKTWRTLPRIESSAPSSIGQPLRRSRKGDFPEEA